MLKTYRPDAVGFLINETLLNEREQTVGQVTPWSCGLAPGDIVRSELFDDDASQPERASAHGRFDVGIVLWIENTDMFAGKRSVGVLWSSHRVGSSKRHA